MAEPASAGVLAFVAFVAAAWLTGSALRRLPADVPLAARRAVAPGVPGPLAALMGPEGPEGSRAFVARVEATVRERLKAWLAARGDVDVDAARLPDAAKALGLHPVLVHALRGGDAEKWCRGDVRSRFRGPEWLFTVWLLFAWHKERDRAYGRYVDLMTRELEKTVMGR